MSIYRALAPAKVNLGLFLGPIRAEDSRHELATVMQSISLADELTLEPAAPGTAQDELVCPGVAGPPEENLAAAGRTQLEFDDNLLLPALYGERDQHLDRIERQLGVSLVPAMAVEA